MRSHTVAKSVRRHGRFRSSLVQESSRIGCVKNCDICASQFVPVTSRQKRCSKECNSVASNTRRRKDATRKKCRTCLVDLPVERFVRRHTSCTDCETLAASGTKRCRGCQLVKQPQDFYTRTSRPDGLSSECRACLSEASRVRNAQESRRLANREAKYLRRYGITSSQVEEMRAKQNGQCAICKALLEKLLVDHDHTTGAVRELLCSRCNSLLGFALDDVSLLQSAIKYLERHSR